MDNYLNLIIIIVLLFCTIYVILVLERQKQNFVSLVEINNKYKAIDQLQIFNRIKCYVIHLERSTDRVEWIEEQQTKTNFKINYFNAIDGKDLNTEELVKNGMLDSYWASIATNNHHACFLSHITLIEKISKLNLNNEYSVIFEDDFNILSKNFDNDIINIINYFEKTQTDFDMIFLGNYALDFIYYDIKIFNNIFTPSTTLNITLEGYIINNKSAKKIYSEINHISAPIDLIFKNLRDSNKIITYVINPALTTQNRELKSIIG